MSKATSETENDTGIDAAEQCQRDERLALLKLDQLADEGRIRRRNIGRSNVWLLTETERDE